MLKKYFTSNEINYMKQCEDMYMKCEFLVNRLFKDRKDKVGNPYVGHLYRVSSKLDTVEGKCAGLLHDTIEDIEGMTAEVLRFIGIDDNIIKVILLVTKTKGLSYNDEIDKIIASNNNEALKLKYSDISDNSDPERLKLLDDNTRLRLEDKYNPQKKKLTFEMKKRKLL